MQRRIEFYVLGAVLLILVMVQGTLLAKLDNKVKQREIGRQAKLHR